MQEVIVYRNPMEAAMWQLVTSGEFFPVIVGVIVFFAVFLTANSVCARIWGQWGQAATYRTYACIALGAIAGAVTVWKMWI
jgi:hypothetical protein